MSVARLGQVVALNVARLGQVVALSVARLGQVVASKCSTANSGQPQYFRHPGELSETALPERRHDNTL